MKGITYLVVIVMAVAIGIAATQLPPLSVIVLAFFLGLTGAAFVKWNIKRRQPNNGNTLK